MEICGHCASFTHSLASAVDAILRARLAFISNIIDEICYIHDGLIFIETWRTLTGSQSFIKCIVSIATSTGSRAGARFTHTSFLITNGALLASRIIKQSFVSALQSWVSLFFIRLAGQFLHDLPFSQV